ncbi:hypothetical protein [Nonomuraea glycinis]|uniref:hypothetical protein n=1 Tax=Nonomuraea glycinis TaxID=2047744 RepID=UPI0033B4F1FD
MTRPDTGVDLRESEIGFAWDGKRWLVLEISNQSTGHCPDVASWAAVEAALLRTEEASAR